MTRTLILALIPVLTFTGCGKQDDAASVSSGSNEGGGGKAASADQNVDQQPDNDPTDPQPDEARPLQELVVGTWSGRILLFPDATIEAAMKADGLKDNEIVAYMEQIKRDVAATKLMYVIRADGSATGRMTVQESPYEYDEYWTLANEEDRSADLQSSQYMGEDEEGKPFVEERVQRITFDSDDEFRMNMEIMPGAHDEVVFTRTAANDHLKIALPDSTDSLAALGSLGVGMTRDQKGRVLAVDLALEVSPEDVSEALQAVSGLHGLKRLSAAFHELTAKDMAALSEATSLTGLRLDDTNIAAGGMEHIAALTRLDTLSLMNAAGVTDDGLTNVAAARALTTLSLNNTTVSDFGLAHLQELTKLQRLSLSGTAVTGTGFEHLVKLRALHNVDVSETPLTAQGLEHVAKLPGLTVLYIDGTKTDDESLEVLTKLENLEFLSLLGTGISADGIKRLKEALPRCEILGP